MGWFVLSRRAASLMVFFIIDTLMIHVGSVTYIAIYSTTYEMAPYSALRYV